MLIFSRNISSMANEVLRTQNLRLLAELQRGQSKCKSLLSSIRDSSSPDRSSSFPATSNTDASDSFEDSLSQPRVTCYNTRDTLDSSRRFLPVTSNSFPISSKNKSLKMGVMENYFQDTLPKTLREDSGYFHSERIREKGVPRFTIPSSASEDKGNQRHKLNVSFETDSDILSSSVATKTSTPTKSHKPTDFGLETPKSILKRRKIIDDNVHVESRYDHTPLPYVTPREKKLNFDYSDDLDADMTGSDFHSDRHTLDGSFSEKGSSISQPYSYRPTVSGVPSALQRDFLLRDSGNDRRNAAIVKTLDSRPKSVIFDNHTAFEKSKVCNNGQRANSSLRFFAFHQNNSVCE